MNFRVKIKGLHILQNSTLQHCLENLTENSIVLQIESTLKLINNTLHVLNTSIESI